MMLIRAISCQTRRGLLLLILAGIGAVWLAPAYVAEIASGKTMELELRSVRPSRLL